MFGSQGFEDPLNFACRRRKHSRLAKSAAALENWLFFYHSEVRSKGNLTIRFDQAGLVEPDSGSLLTGAFSTIDNVVANVLLIGQRAVGSLSLKSLLADSARPDCWRGAPVS
jgi:hypothetical protein